MLQVKAIEVNTKADWKKFLQVPWMIYAGDPNWVPPLLMEQRKQFNKNKNPSLKHTLFKAWIVYQEKIIVGRIVAFVDTAYNEHNAEECGFLGFFECANQQEVANELFNAGLTWLKANKMNKIYGPMNFSIANECGVQLTGFDTPPVISMSYTPAYYSSLFERAGFSKANDMYAYMVSQTDVREKENILTRLKSVCERIVAHHGMVLRTIKMNDYKTELRHINDLYNSFMINNWGFVPVSNDEMMFTGESMKLVADPELILFAEVKGKVVGCSLAIPDFNQVLIHLNGRLWPFGIFKMFYHKRKINRLRIMLLGINEEYRLKGLDILFYYTTIIKGLEHGYDEGELSWISEDNKVLLSIVEKLGARRYKTYRMYQMGL